MSGSAPFGLVAGRYGLEQRLGSGASGEVWRATDTLLNRPVAVKLLRPELVGQQLARRRLQAEARHVGSLTHAAIAKVYDYDENGPSGRPYLVTEYVDGHSLAEELSAGPVGPARAMDLVAQIAAGLHAAHSAGLAHGDLKPHNVLIDSAGLVKLTDFRVAAAASAAEVTVPETLLGTPEYQAPERLTGGKTNAAADLYSLGILAYQCLSGRVPFRGRAVDVAEAHRSWPLPPLPGDAPADVARLVTELTAKDPGSRPASAGAVAERAAALRDELALESPPGVAAALADPAASPPAVVGPEPARLIGPEPAADVEPVAGRTGLARMPLLFRWLLAVAVAVAAAAVGWAALPGPSPGGRPPGGAAPRVHLVDVNPAALRGQPVAQVATHLRAEGLVVTIRWLPDSAGPAGLVLSVRPDGWLPAGTRVLIIASAPAGSASGGPVPVASAPPYSGGPVLPPSPRPSAPRLPSPRPHPTGSSAPPVLTSPPPTIPLPSASPSSTSPPASPTPTATPTPTPGPSGSASAREVGTGSQPYPSVCGMSGTDWVVASLGLPGTPCPPG